ncbi:aryl-sulfate sulfotransferase [Bifidobacterium eulemuris]|uniref:Aryl-sulfate sulfotransferase n=1 Tax=Bifidobacterium eulemuris TaxID=1765219 RepID=A0A261GBS2_9BIFI|nr:aryl-sulfate sulfotransferase [Bifidobacterium eulemuris]OZG68879.1 arylsulfate sulfotransferase [Bifidobacterium eulemuris]QOL31579.1 aryl-sulfate sulfotransferase [Bifidobacterium eulemuris]
MSSTHGISRKRVLTWTTAMVTTLIAVGMCMLTQSDMSEALQERRVDLLNDYVEQIYTDDYQQKADEKLAEARADGGHTVDDMLIEENPYGTNTTSLYVYFTTDEPSNVSYTISVEGYPDFTRSVAQDEEYQTEHEFTVIGLIPEEKNTIVFTITDEDGGTTTSTVTRTGAKLLGNEEVQLERTVTADDGTDLGDGLYAILGNDSDEQDFMFYYDTDGVLRGEVPVPFYRSHRILFDDEGLMWFSASTHLMVGMNNLGKLEKIYNLGDQFILHHDYAMDDDGDIVLLATDLTREDHTVQDQIVRLDTDSGEVDLLLDLGDMFPDYKESTDHAGTDESDPDATNRWDWIHINTIQLLPDGSALLSARETSTIIKVADIEGTPTLEYMIGEDSVWDGTEYQAAFLTKDGDFPDTGGQHSITYVADDSLEDGQYYLYMFDNTFGYAATRPDYDWTVIDGINTAYSPATEGAYSQYRRYLVDETAGTYTEVSSFDVPYSAYVSSAQELDDGDILIDSGMQGLFGVYGEDGTLKAQYSMALNTTYIYRVYSYDFSGFYFA